MKLAAGRHAVRGVIGEIQNNLRDLVLIHFRYGNPRIEIRVDAHALHFEVVLDQ